MREKTGFDRWFDEKMKGPKFAAGYRRERARINSAQKAAAQRSKKAQAKARKVSS